MLNYSSATDQYKRTSINTASSVELIVMLYDGAIRFIEAGMEAMAKKDYDQQNHQLTRAQKIISELMICLNLKEGGEVAANLFGLYNFMLNELIDANVRSVPDNLNRIKAMLAELREAWAQIDAQTAAPPAQDRPRIQLQG